VDAHFDVMKTMRDMGLNSIEDI